MDWSDGYQKERKKKKKKTKKSKERRGKIKRKNCCSRKRLAGSYVASVGISAGKRLMLAQQDPRVWRQEKEEKATTTKC